MIQTNICCSINEKIQQMSTTLFCHQTCCCCTFIRFLLFTVQKSFKHNISNTFDDYYYELTKYPRMCVCVCVSLIVKQIDFHLCLSLKSHLAVKHKKKP